MSQLEAFLEHHVEGYLFGDLETMIAAQPLPGRSVGALGYPLLASCCAGIELMGGLLHAKTFHPGHGAKHFREFWQQHLYPSRRDLYQLVYKLVRHGLAHVFFTKGDFKVTKDHPELHLTKDGAGAIWIDGSQFVSGHQEPRIFGEVHR